MVLLRFLCGVVCYLAVICLLDVFLDCLLVTSGIDSHAVDCVWIWLFAGFVLW